MRATYRVLAHLIMLGVLVQAAAVAGGWFGTINDVDGGAVVDKNYEGNIGHAVHGIVGMTVMPLLAIALLVVAFFTKLAGAVKWAGFTLLAVAVQITLAFIAFGVPVVGALHGLNAFVIFGCAAYAGRKIAATSQAGQVRREESATV